MFACNLLLAAYKFLFLLKLQTIMPHLDYADIIYVKPNHYSFYKKKIKMFDVEMSGKNWGYLRNIPR